MNSIENANSQKHYLLITLSIVIGMVGVYLRFGGDAPAWSWASNAILVVGVIIALKAVKDILG